jgi:hypothetical protein
MGGISMALARCDEHKPEPIAPDVVSYALPLGYPNSAVTCDVVGCEKPARLWLSEDERRAYQGGTRVFAVPGGTRVRVSDDLFPN